MLSDGVEKWYFKIWVASLIVYDANYANNDANNAFSLTWQSIQVKIYIHMQTLNFRLIFSAEQITVPPHFYGSILVSACFKLV